ncbi:MAG TPA: hypothetical protein VMT24_16340, partial [Aggregatilineaceae bacterium]|nr:hypothetical protein [Aggregatilineaceae bacterium]
MSIVMAVVAGIVGVAVGGVINVLADDLPVPQTPGVPHYPDGTLRPRTAWLGLAAFLTGQRTSPAPDPVEATESSDPAGEPQTVEGQPAQPAVP